MEPDPPPPIFWFGAFELDTRKGELRKHGVRLHLQEQPLKILIALLERPGEIVTREDLVRTVWPEGVFVDFERGLNAAINRLRQALDDSAVKPRYIETIARKGYRFLLPVNQPKASPETAVLPGADQKPRAGRISRWLWTAGGAALMLLGVLAVAWLGPGPKHSMLVLNCIN